MQQHWFKKPAKQLSENDRDKAIHHQTQLTKPPGALGRLEEIAIQLAAMQKKILPSIENINIVVFAGDHGIADQNVSAFPQAVTVEMIKNFSRGGAAINVLANQLNAEFKVINMGTICPTDGLDHVINKPVAAGTADFSQTQAMTEHHMLQALITGSDVIDQLPVNTDLFIAGEMGIANTSSATAMAAAVLEKDASVMTGAGTGLDKDGVTHKVTIINNALKKHNIRSDKPLDILQTFGGFEIAAIAGSYIRCAQLGIPVLVDGFITSSAALMASRINPGVKDWLIFSHASAEPGHQLIMSALDAKPLIDLSLRLGEGSGAAIATPLIINACKLHAEMATFESAGVSEKSE